MCGYQIWQRTDNLDVFMVAPQVENLLDNYNIPVKLTEDRQFYAEGVASKLYFKPLEVMKDKMPALHHLAKCSGHKKTVPHRPKLGHRAVYKPAKYGAA